MPKAAKDKLKIFTEFAEGLKDLERFSHMYLIVQFDHCRRLN